ncbi:xanthine dehydrogenase family protein subunit M [Rhodococcus sp. X156]|uniref:FAD binding domain-containing protein n=1 Tax=Rhodococcus sp. X156 TaxID=2499145 RepID=UPI000FD96F02|nr:xanthine dehydrogenase family protein subunit M [Rhodococcus sp. X156]
MIPGSFDYVAPTTVAEALQVLAAGGEDAKVLGGGQSLMPVLRLRMAAPTLVVDLNKVAELRGIAVEGDELVIGAMTTHHDVLHSPLVAEHAALLALTTATVADPQIRHRGTLGGALVHADPAGDLGAPVLALDASLVLASPTGTRTVAAADFFQDLFTTAVQPGELLTQVRLPRHTGWGARYEKFQRVAQAWSVVAVAAAVRLEGGTIAQAKVALTNMASTPVRAAAVEAALLGQPATAESVRAAAAQAGVGTSPGSDVGADAAYRTHLAGVLTRRAVSAAAGIS